MQEPTAQTWVDRLAPPAVVVGPTGRIVATNRSWDALTPPSARRGVQVGVGADYLAVTRAAADRGDPDAAQVAELVEGVLDGSMSDGDVDYPCPDPHSHRWYRLSAVGVELDGRHALVVHRPTAPPPPLQGSEVTSAGVAHDLRNALHTATGFAAMLRDRGEAAAPEDRRTWTEAVARQLDRALQLVVGADEPTDGGPRTAAPEVVPVARALAGASELAGVDPLLHGEQDVAVRCDPEHLVRVFANLFTNADKYGRPPVEVAVARQGPRVHLDVTDHGDGIPADVAGRLFTPHARGHGPCGGFPAGQRHGARHRARAPARERRNDRAPAGLGRCRLPHRPPGGRAVVVTGRLSRSTP